MIVSKQDLVLKVISQWRRTLKPSFTEITIIEEIIDDEPLIPLPHREVHTHTSKGFSMQLPEGVYNTRKSSIGNTADTTYSRIANFDVYVYDFFKDDLLVPKTQVALTLISGEKLALTVEVVERLEDGSVYLFSGCENPTEEAIP